MTESFWISASIRSVIAPDFASTMIAPDGPTWTATLAPPPARRWTLPCTRRTSSCPVSGFFAWLTRGASAVLTARAGSFFSLV